MKVNKRMLPLLFVTLAGCGSTGNDAPHPTPTPIELCGTNYGLASLDDPAIRELRADAYPSNVLRRTIRFETPTATPARVLFWAEGEELARVSDASPAGTDHAVTLVGLLPQTTYHARALALQGDGTLASERVSFTTEALPPDVPTFELTAAAEDAGDLSHRGHVLTSWIHQDKAERETCAFTILDDQARVVWYEFVPIEEPFLLAMSQWTHERTFLVIQNRGTIIEQTLGGEILRTIEVTENLPLHNEIVLREDGTITVLTTLEQTVDRSSIGGSAATVMAGDGILVLQPDGTPSWTWSAFEAFDPLVDTAVKPRDDGSLHWLDANAMAVDVDGNYLLSWKIAGQIVKIDATTGAVLWRLGGEGSDFQLPEGARFFNQHHLSVLGEGRLMMFDNGHPTERPVSRALELQLDEVAKTASLVWEHALPEDLFSRATSSATRLHSGNTLMLSGTNTTILNVTADHQVVWSARGTPGIGYRAVPLQLDACSAVPVP